MNRSVLPFLLIALLSFGALSGCLDQTDSEAVLLIDFDGAHRDEDGQRVAATISFDRDARPSESLYEARNVQHPNYYTAHDLLFAWMQDTNTPAEWGYFQDLGFALKSLDHVRCDFSLGDECYWQLVYNGKPSSQGMSELRVRNHDSVEWVYTPI